MSEKQAFHTACPSCHRISLVLPEKAAASGNYKCPSCNQRFRAEEFWTEPPDDTYNDLSFPETLAARAEESKADDSDENPRLPESLSDIIIPGELKRRTEPVGKVPTAPETETEPAPEDGRTAREEPVGPASPDTASGKNVTSSETRADAPRRELKSPFRDPDRDRHRRSSFQARTLSFPVELKYRSIEYGRKLLLSATCVVLVMALLVQFAWYNPQHLSGIDLPEPLCSVLPCPNAAFSADDYNSLFLQVREHPERLNSLLVSFAFSNDSTREIPFPVARLSFFDEQGTELIARRDFMPDEYLPAQLGLLELMPSGSQAQAELEILDPGPDAAKYTMALLPDL